MNDIWANVNALDRATQERLAAVLETRGADAQQQQMREAFLSTIAFPPSSRVVDIGCGTGVLTRRLAGWPDVDSVIGVDISVSLLDRARSLCAELTNVSFQEGDAAALPFADHTFDVAVLDSTLSHVAAAERAVAEAVRLLRPGGLLAVFDGNYSTTTVALGDDDPLQACADAMMTSSVSDRWLMRRLPGIVAAQGLELLHHESHGYVETTEADYFLTVIGRGADKLLADGILGEALCAALKAEAERRVAEGSFYGLIAYTSLVARLGPGARHPRT